MKITREVWGKTPEGKEIFRYTLVNAGGAFVRLCDVGAAIVSIAVPDRDCTPEELAGCEQSYTGKFLAPVLKRKPHQPAYR